MANDFLPFGTAGGAPVLSNAAYSGIVPANGFPPGILPKEKLNKALRQSCTMAAALGGFIDQQGYSAWDDGNLAGLISQIDAAINQRVEARFAQLAISGGFPIYGGAANGTLQIRFGLTAAFPQDSTGNVVTYTTPFPGSTVAVFLSPFTDFGIDPAGTLYAHCAHTYTASGFTVTNDALGNNFKYLAIGT
jgi:hypothetical protein